MGWIEVGVCGEVWARRERKSSVWARARAEARVPIRRVRGGGEGEEVVGSVEGW